MSLFNEEWNRLMPEDLAFVTSSDIGSLLQNLNYELKSNENETIIQDQSSYSMCHTLDDSKRSTFKKISLNNTLEDCFT